MCKISAINKKGGSLPLIAVSPGIARNKVGEPVEPSITPSPRGTPPNTLEKITQTREVFEFCSVFDRTLTVLNGIASVQMAIVLLNPLI